MSSIDDFLFLSPTKRPIPATGRGLLANETPLRPSVRMAGALPPALDLDAGDQSVRSALNCIIANAMLAGWQPHIQWLFYSRDNNHFAAVRAGAPAWYSRRTVVTAVDVLTNAQLIETQPTTPAPSARLRSRLRATPSLATACGVHSLHDLCWDLPPSVILRDRADRKLLDPKTSLSPDDLAQFELLTQDVEAHNHFLSRFEIDLQNARHSETAHLEVANHRVNPLQRSYHRVFNGNLQLGGRWYAPWWQSIPGSLRQQLTIDGRPTIELDFAACQLRLLLAKCGQPDPLAGHIRHPDSNFDLYRVDGIERGIVKQALLFMLNADARRRARGALSHELNKRGETQPSRLASYVMLKIETAFPLLRPFWFTGVGLELQCIDAAVCTAIQRRMRALDLPVLSIHDSFVTFRRAEAVLQNAMRDCFNAAYDATAAGSRLPFAL